MPVGSAASIAAGVLAIALRPAAVTTGGTGAGITEAEAVETFRELQANLYRAFDYETEDQVYDVLAQSVDGALLDDIYTEVYQSLLVIDKSAAVCKVHEVEVLESTAKAIDPAPRTGTANASSRLPLAGSRIGETLRTHPPPGERVPSRLPADPKAEGGRSPGLRSRSRIDSIPKTMAAKR